MFVLSLVLLLILLLLVELLFVFSWFVLGVDVVLLWLAFPVIFSFVCAFVCACVCFWSLVVVFVS